VDATVNIHNPLSEQQAAQMCNFGRKHQRYLVAIQCKIREDYLGEDYKT